MNMPTVNRHWHGDRMNIALPAFHRFNRPVRLYLFTDALSCFTVEWGMYAILLNLYLLRLGYVPAQIGIVG